MSLSSLVDFICLSWFYGHALIQQDYNRAKLIKSMRNYTRDGQNDSQVKVYEQTQKEISHLHRNQTLMIKTYVIYKVFPTLSTPTLPSP